MSHPRSCTSGASPNAPAGWRLVGVRSCRPLDLGLSPFHRHVCLCRARGPRTLVSSAVSEAVGVALAALPGCDGSWEERKDGCTKSRRSEVTRAGSSTHGPVGMSVSVKSSQEKRSPRHVCPAEGHLPCVTLRPPSPWRAQPPTVRWGGWPSSQAPDGGVGTPEKPLPPESLRPTPSHQPPPLL